MERRTGARGRAGVIADTLYSILRLIARHVSGFFGALAAFLTIGMLVGVAAVSVFAGFASLVAGGFTQQFDEAILRWIEARRSPMLDQFMIEFSTLGSGVVLILIVLVAITFLWLTRHKWSVYMLLMGVVGGTLLNHLLKAEFERPRPSVVKWVYDVHSLSFPSGHAMAAVITYGTAAYLVARVEPTRVLRNTTWGFAIFIILIIGISRMYLGVHYPTDVIAGYIGGVAWLSFVVATMSALKFFAARRPEVNAEEADLHAEEQRAAGTRS